jgi:phage terminase large subunit
LTSAKAAPNRTTKPTQLYKPRPQFLPFHNRNKRWTVLVCHRRSGKTTANINDLITKGLYTKKSYAQFAYVAPHLKQAKRIAWEFLKRFSQFACKRVNEAELYVELTNGTKIFIFGADDPDSARGIYLDGVVIDEAAQVKSSFCTEVVRPALSDRQGWAVLMGTPKGKHNLLYSRFEMANKNTDKWFVLVLKASETGIIGPQELAELKEEMDDAEFEQEYECSFEAALVGSIYGKHIKQLEKRGKFVDKVLFNPEYPVSLSMDVGRRDETAIWFWQLIAGEIRFIEYIQLVGSDAEEVCDILRLKPYTYKDVWLPHDAFHKTFASKKSSFDTFIEYGLPVRKVPNPDFGNKVKDGISAVRQFMRRWPITFAQGACAQGIEALKNYSHQWQQKLQQYGEQPKHDRYSHGADAFRYAVLSISREDLKRSEDEPERYKPQTSDDTDKIKNDRINTILQRRFTFDDALRAHDRRIALQRTERRPRI